MNNTKLLLQAERNSAKGWSWCFVTPQQIFALVADLHEAQGRLERIAGLAQDAHLAWIDHDRERERRLLEEIKKQANLKTG